MEKQFNGIIEVNGKNVRYTACVAERFAHIVDNEHAIACAIVLDYIGAEKIKEDSKQALFNMAFTTDSTIADIIEFIDSVRAPRKPREMSDDTKRKNYEKQLAKLKNKYGIED